MLFAKINIFYFLLCFTTVFSMIQVEIISPIEAANRYINADLIIIGSIFSIQSDIIDRDEKLSSDSLKFIASTIQDIYKVKVDSVLKGELLHETIDVFSEKYTGHSERIKFDYIDSNGDSIFVCELNGIDNSHQITLNEKYIMCLANRDNHFLCKFIRHFSENELDFIEKISREGNFFIK